MTTLAANALRVYEGDVRIEESALPVIASDIVYEGAAVGVVDGTGHTRPLVGGVLAAGRLDDFADYCRTLTRSDVRRLTDLTLGLGEVVHDYLA